jgi:hypothetical protein
VVSTLLLGLMLGSGHPIHPMHTSATELRESGGGTVSIRIRVFADDLRNALGSDRQPADSTVFRYVSKRFSLTGPTGQPFSLQWIAVERAGAVLLLQLRARLPGGLAGARLTNDLLCERFTDQVNIVRASYGGRTTTLLFIPGDGAKALP